MLTPAGAGAAGATLDMYLGGTGPAGAPDAIPARTRALFVFGEHAREVVPTELAIRLARDLCAAPAAAPVRFRAGARAGAYSALLASLRSRPLALTMLPLANAAGRAAVEAGALCTRGNGAGVDVNRNWPTHWHAGDPRTAREQDPGAAPFSEPETRALRDALAARRPTLFLSVHSGTRGLYAPPAWAPVVNNVVAIAAAPAGLALAGLLSAPPQRLPHGDGVPLLRIGCNGEFLDRGGGHAGAGVGAPQKTRQRKSAATPPTASRV